MNSTDQIKDFAASSQLLTSESCREHLKSVIDPEIFHNIVDLGLVYACEVGGNNEVTVTMTLTTPQCPLGPQIIEDVQNTLTARGATKVAVDLVWEPMWTPSAMTAELQKELGLVDEEEVAVEIPPSPPPKKKGLFARLFGL